MLPVTEQNSLSLVHIRNLAGHSNNGDILNTIKRENLDIVVFCCDRILLRWYFNPIYCQKDRAAAVDCRKCVNDLKKCRRRLGISSRSARTRHVVNLIVASVKEHTFQQFTARYTGRRTICTAAGSPVAARRLRIADTSAPSRSRCRSGTSTASGATKTR